MKEYTVKVHENVHATITVKVHAKSAKEAAQQARAAWVADGVGDLSEDVEGRWVEIDGKEIETSDND